MSNLRDVFDQVIDGLDNGTFAKEEFVPQRHEPIFRFFPNGRNQLHTLSKELFEKILMRHHISLGTMVIVVAMVNRVNIFTLV